MKKIILASQSPRRSEILQKAGYHFVSIPSHVSEIPDKNLNLNDQIIDIARRKARACKSQNQGLGPESLILAADTVVCLGDEMLGKPLNRDEAFATLRKLSGRTHHVKTAVFIIDLVSGDEVSHLETTEVIFRKLSDVEINQYIDTKDPFDKAGSYGIQSGAGHFVEKLLGDFDNVVGLPLLAIEKLFMMKSWVISRNLKI